MYLEMKRQVLYLRIPRNTGYVLPNYEENTKSQGFNNLIFCDLDCGVGVVLPNAENGWCAFLCLLLP
jgi:hypothetical protein